MMKGPMEINIWRLFFICEAISLYVADYLAVKVLEAVGEGIHLRPHLVHALRAPAASHLLILLTLLLKGTVAWDGYFFWRPLHFNRYFLCMRWWFSMSFKSFSLPYTTSNFLFASLKLLPNFENAYWNPPPNFLLYDWLVFLVFSSADLSLAAGKMRKN